MIAGLFGKYGEIEQTRGRKMNIEGYELILTCCACPEQYDVFKDGIQVGYLRLRHGYFYASIPDCSDNIVYEAEPDGDGCFDFSEREFYLKEAIKAIVAEYTKETAKTGYRTHCRKLTNNRRLTNG